MSWLRAVLRRLDPWAALLLGGLLAMGVVILLATPGPWQKVVGKEPPVHLEAPSPDDVAVFVMGGRAASCSGVVWLHVDAERHAVTAVVVAPAVSGFSPTDGFAPISAIADSAGPGSAAAALGGALGVSMDAWVALDRAATDLAVQAMVPMNDVKAARTRYRAARAAWRGRGGVRAAWPTQYRRLRVALPQVQFQDLGVVAFANYVLGFGFVRSDLTLQGATSLGEALRDVNRSRVEVRAAPVIVERSRGGEVWRADASAIEPLRQSLAIGIVPPESDRLVTMRVRAARVLVVAPFARRAAQRLRGAGAAALAASAGAPVQVSAVWGADTRLAFRAARELEGSRRSPCWLRRPAEGAPRGGAEGVRDAAQPPAGGRRHQDRCRRLPRRRCGSDGRRSSPVGCRCRGCPTRSPPRAPRSGPAVSLSAAARDNVQTLVRACWPGTLAPRLRSTRLGFTFIEARHTGVGVVGASEPAVAGMLQRLRLWGYPAGRLTLEGGGWQPPAPGPLVCYRPGSRVAATGPRRRSGAVATKCRQGWRQPAQTRPRAAGLTAHADAACAAGMRP